MDKLYTIQEVATKLNLSDKTLRRWEEAGRFVSSRTLGNQRRYSLEDLQILDAIKHGTINEQKDLLNITQASKLCGVSPTTLLRWEENGKIHPIITSGNTYYPRQKLIEKMDELKKLYVEPAFTPPQSTPAPIVPEPEHTVELEPKPMAVANKTLEDVKPSKANLNLVFANILITLVLLTSYHLLFNRNVSKGPVSPQSGSVQGVSTVAAPDPRLDDLILKFKDHLQAQMLKDAKPIANNIIKLDGTSLITGTSTLGKNQNQVSVPAEKLTSTTPVTVTFTSDYSPAKKYWVTPGEASFTIYTDFPVSADSTFNYSFIAPSIAQAPTSTPSATPVLKKL
ncbi:MAG: MerR family DNA-binding transcriptional regulator [bacterium]